MEKPLTIVLPMYNSERQLRSSVLDILELAQSTNAMIEVVVVDDGSTDETYETACEMARAYPQVKALRQPVRLGLGAALEMVGHRLSTDMVVVHDGETAVEASQLKEFLQAAPRPRAGLRQASMREAVPADSVGSRRFASVRALQSSMEQAHRSIIGFRWVQLERPVVPRRRVASQVIPISVPISPTVVPTGMTPTL